MFKNKEMDNSCNNCNKRTILLFPCKCDNKFCSRCRLPEVHMCVYKHSDKTLLRKKLIKIESKKIDKI
jgi:predicted nucleic acid binding AN1-type Zn finger protein